MNEYKFYSIGEDGHVSGPPAVHTLADDQAAIKKANLAAIRSDIKIWQGHRMVAYVVADETRQVPPGNKPDHDQHR